jgi:hypothetical protein
LQPRKRILAPGRVSRRGGRPNLGAGASDVARVDKIRPKRARRVEPERKTYMHVDVTETLDFLVKTMRKMVVQLTLMTGPNAPGL